VLSLKRRDVIKGLTTVGFLNITEGSAHRDTRNFAQDKLDLFNGYNGVPRHYFEDSNFRDRVEEDFNYQDPSKLVQGEPNMIVDFRVYDNLDVDISFYDEVEDFFSEHGVNTMCIEYGENLDSSNIENHEQAIKILGNSEIPESIDSESVYSRIDTAYQNLGVQVFLVPWDIAGPNGGYEFTGIALGTRSVVEFGRNIESNLDITKHEILHTLGLDHSDNPDNLMYYKEGGSDLNPCQWEEVREQLS
jgi:hypothetical protein